ncbi:MAG: hypothetical protein IT502_01940 [Rubrivivax sp.]|nr:hypothetical protein [Rubrivivax sp.]
MARTAYWVISEAIWGTPDNAEIRAGQLPGSIGPALAAGSESFAAASGAGSITEATLVNTLKAAVQYRLSWTLHDDVADNYPASAPQHTTWLEPPELSSPGATDVTATTARPTVTLAF